MAQAESILLSRCREWKVFGTGTFETLPRSLADERKLVFAFLYEVAKLSRVSFGGLLWCTRREHGERSSRVHYHWLIGAEGWTPTIGECFQMNHIWLKLPRCGWSRNRVYCPDQSGIEYIMKCLNVSNAVRHLNSGGDFYESNKFSLRGAEVTLSNSLVRVVGGSRVVELKH